jgi:5-(carboxyamino)imidazole ribonucleotide synthase
MKIGILGSGQLARMITIAAQPLNIATLSISSDPQDRGNGVTPHFIGSFHNEADREAFCTQVDLLTYETENIPLEIVEACRHNKLIKPSSDILRIAQDRLFEKEEFQNLAIPTTEFYPVSSLEEFAQALIKTGYPAILKTRRFGYDGKGQFIVRQPSEMAQAFESLKNSELILEAFVAFDKEVSLIAVRNSTETRFYRLVENIHQSGILRYSKITSDKADLQNQAERYAEHILKKYDYQGVLTIEFFVKENQLIANEMAPRVHNSGHWTFEGSYTSQFENHIRAILDLPLGSCEASHPYVAMFNFIGTLPEKAQLLKLENVSFHDYAKIPKTDRKLGHITLVENDKKQFEMKCLFLEKFIGFNKIY